MAKAFVFSDVHGFYNELMTALEGAGFNYDDDSHIIISCGDLCDRGPDAVKCLEFVMDLYHKGRAVLVRGNHEDLMEKAIARREFLSHDYHNRTNDTVYQITGITPDIGTDSMALEKMRENELWNDYINACIDYYESGKNIFVHGWIPVYYRVGTYWDTLRFDPNWRTGDWEQARWLNGMDMWGNENIRVPDKTIWCGHYHTSWGHSRLHNKGPEWDDEWFILGDEEDLEKAHFEPFVDKGIVALDACTAVNHFVNVKTIGKFKKLNKKVV